MATINTSHNILHISHTVFSLLGTIAHSNSHISKGRQSFNYELISGRCLVDIQISGVLSDLLEYL